MLSSSAARRLQTRASRSVNSSLLGNRRNYHGGALSSRIASPLRTNETSTESSVSIHPTAMKRRRCILSPTVQRIIWKHQYHRSFSTSVAGSSDSSSAKTKTPSTASDTLPSVATTGTIGSHLQPIPTERDLAIAGGVFAVTSAKRDKLGEFKGALGEEHDTLDDLATEEELLDLHLADGIKLIAGLTDAGSDLTEKDADNSSMEVVKEFSAWLDDLNNDSSETDDVSRTALEIKMEVVSAKLDNLLEAIPPDRCFRNIRDFLDPRDLREKLKDYDGEGSPFDGSNEKDSDDLSVPMTPFWDSVARFRLLLAKSAIEQVLNSWKILTTVSDADIDRKATQGVALEPELDTVSLSKVVAFLQQNVSSSCSDRVTAAWDLMDRDQDGSLDQEEMHRVVHLCLDIETKAMTTLFEETLDAFPVRAPLSAIESDDEDVAPPKGWRQRRAEKKTKKRLTKLFQQSCKKHFVVEVELNHRLRCLYSWANKADQGNQLKSILVDEQTGWTGRKRYVELSPKISEAEFREVQEIHFKHMGRLGDELATSFREDLWVLQGKRRERNDLLRNSFLFLAGVSVIDYIILIL